MSHYKGDSGERSSSLPDANNRPSLDLHAYSGASAGSMAHWGASDYYLRNQLQNYSFGTAPRLSNSPTTNPVTVQDDPELEEILLRADITPRPSVAANVYPSLPRISTFSRTPRRDSMQRVGPSVHDPSAGRGVHDSMPSSASASVTSFSESLYTGSVVSVDSSSAPQTPSNEFTSSEDDEEHRHPFYIIASGPYPGSSANASTTSMEFSSEEEYESDEAPDIEISSARVASVDMSFQEEEEYLADEASYYQGRRGSLPMAIPAIPAMNTQYTFGRDRDEGLISLRRPSRSLDDDLNITEAMRGLNVLSRARSDDPSPVSVPGSEGDWRNLSARARQIGSDSIDGHELEFLSAFSSRGDQVQSSTDVNAVGEFDPVWGNLAQGIVSFEQSEVADIVRVPCAPNTGRTVVGSRWFPRFGSRNNQSADHGRRPSIATITSVGSDTFGRAVFRWGGEEYEAQRQDWTFRREKTSIVQQVPGASGSGGMGSRGFAGFLGSKTPEDDKKKTQKEREKARVPASWKGMSIDSQEIWKLSTIGKFKVERKTTKSVYLFIYERRDFLIFEPPQAADIAKGPQQRIIVHHLRDADNDLTSATAGPTSTVHKHSKAVAFSVGRFYRKKNENKDKLREISSGPLITASHPPAPSPDSQKRPGGMILLAPRRVQVAFTNTTSTRKLESHGLLDKDRSSRVKKDGDSTHEREREKDKKEKDKKKERGKQKDDEKEKQKLWKKQELKGKERVVASLQLETTTATSLDDAVTSTDISRIANVSSGSDTYQTASVISSTTVVAPSLSSPSMELSVQTHVPVSDTLNQFITPVANRPRRRRRRIYDPLELNEDEDDYEYETDGRYSPPTRTPHSEAYGTVDASLIEQINLERVQNELEPDSVFKRFFRSRNSRTAIGPATGHLEANYHPPWIVLPSRSKQEQQQRVVENLNSSFMDVGLLPSTHKTKKRSGSTRGRKRDDQATGFLSEVPEDSLFMLLPLWPGETDPISTQDHLHLVKRIPPSDQRQYVLIYYQPQNSQKKGDKKKHPSPSVEGELAGRSILLTSFHISARFVAHNDLNGTGIRVPDEGLTISGPLDYAWETLPSTEAREECKSDWVIGVCNSRESGVEFLPEGLVRMDLCRMSWKPPSAVSDSYVPPEPTLHLTPIGRSVMEMAWLGAMALTSFGRVGQC